ncbi:hypothetical protein LTR66_012499 [Elasticomyces elasticus]|nr:hypothetical protein LTR66_012499 [Elasticomyces elasticus]
MFPVPPRVPAETKMLPAAFITLLLTCSASAQTLTWSHSRNASRHAAGGSTSQAAQTAQAPRIGPKVNIAVINDLGALKFIPPALNVSVGTLVRFQFVNSLSSLLMWDTEHPCRSAGAHEPLPQRPSEDTVEYVDHVVGSTFPLWFACAEDPATLSCAAGTVFSLNEHVLPLDDGAAPRGCPAYTYPSLARPVVPSGNGPALSSINSYTVTATRASQFPIGFQNFTLTYASAASSGGGQGTAYSSLGRAGPSPTTSHPAFSGHAESAIWKSSEHLIRAYICTLLALMW